MRRGCTDWWINYFKSLRESGAYNDGNPVHVECLKFCYHDILRIELNKVAMLWNLHRIRPSTNTESPAEKPDVMYFIPEITGTTDFKAVVDEDDLQTAREMFAAERPRYGCSATFSELAVLLIEDNGLDLPHDVGEAETLYTTLLELIEAM